MENRFLDLMKSRKRSRAAKKAWQTRRLNKLSKIRKLAAKKAWDTRRG